MSKFRDKIAHFIATPEVKKRIDEGVTDDNFFDYGAYVNLIAKSLRRMANDRHSYTVLNYRLPPNYIKLSTEELEELANAETVLLNKWADILSIADIDLMDEPYYKPYWDHISGARSEPVKWDEKGKPTLFQMNFPEHTEETEDIQKHMEQHEHTIHMLHVDILMELAENHRYMWD